MRSYYFFGSAVIVSVLAGSCAPEPTPEPPLTGGTGGSGVGGATGGTGGSGGTGGVAATGGVGTGGVTTGGTGGVAAAGGMAATGGVAATGGAQAGASGAGAGVAGSGGAAVGGAAGAGAGTSGAGGSSAGTAGVGGANSGGAGGGAGSGAGSGAGGGGNAMGPCDIYEAGMPASPCVGAYSTIRRLRAAYTGPLFQVRSGSNAMNTGTGGMTHDIMQSADGFALKSAVDAACGAGICTVSLLYDQSGRGNHLPVAKRGLSNGGEFADEDDFETTINVAAAGLKVGGRDVYSLYMAARQGYRLTEEGDGVPLGRASQGLYMLADGTHYGTACCWDFGNVSPDPTRYGVMNTLFLGIAYWGRGAGQGPWYMADYEAGVWAGGTNPGDPGWGALEGEHPPNPANPSLRVKYALGFLKTNMNNWSLRMADAGTATTVTTAYAGGLPKQMNNEGAIVLGVGGDNSNNSWGTFYEGAVLAGFPSDATELAVLQNIKAVGYGQ
jgi:non-reducing end alpha-L-arabinofuranosidase